MIYKFEDVLEEVFLTGSRTAVLSLEWRHAPCTSLALWGGSTDVACRLHVVAVVWCAPTGDELERKAKGWGGKRGSTRGEYTALALCVALLLHWDAGASSLSFSTAAGHAGYIFSRNTKLHKTTHKKAVTVRRLYQNFFVEFAERARSLVSASLTVLPNSALSVGVRHSCWYLKRTKHKLTLCFILIATFS